MDERTRRPESFWLGLGPIDDSKLPAVRDKLAIGRPIPDGSRFVVDVLRDDSGEPAYAVLLSTLAGQQLCCRAAFCNDAAWSDALRRQGFRVFEVAVTHERQGNAFKISVEDPVQIVGTKDECGDSVDLPPPDSLLEISGVVLDTAPKSGGKVCQVVYSQESLTPEVGATNTKLSARDSSVSLPRVGSVRSRGKARFKPGPSAAVELGLSDEFDFRLAWHGSLQQPLARSIAAAPKRSRSLRHYNRDIQIRGFRFDDVELIGMHVDLRHLGREADEALKSILEPLNFHLRLPVRAGYRVADFEYRPAARAVVIELLRYGKMYLGERRPEQGGDPFDAQHELLLRVLVGRVDDGSAQARDPAIYVPAIFVDNASSQIVGREFQGFSKQLARFVDRYGKVVSPRNATTGEPPLFEIGRVELERRVSPIGKRLAGRPIPIFTLDVPPIAPDWFKSAERLDSLAATIAGGASWRQGDFSRREFRRSFARDVLQDGPNSFRSIQVVPLDGQQLPQALIDGRFTLENLRGAFPSGVLTFKLDARQADDGAPAVPAAWNLLRQLVGNEGEVALPSGDWYIARGSMRLRVDEGLGGDQGNA